MYFIHKSIFFEIKMFIIRSLIFLNLSFVFLFFIACTPINQVKGYLPVDLKTDIFQKKKTSKEEVLFTIGEPVIKNYDDSEWIYFKESVEKFAFFNPKVEERDIFVFHFDNNNNLSKINKYDLKDKNVLNIEKSFVKTEGKKISFLEQMLGNLGNFSPNQFFE